MPGTSEALRLIELTSAHLCQHISSLTGVLNDALGARVEDLPPDPELYKLAGMAAAHLTRRLQLLRAAWGPDHEPLPAEQVLLLARGLPPRVRVDLTALDASCLFPSRVGRIVLNLLLLGADSLPSGGTILLAGSADDLFLRIVGPAAAWPAGLGACVVDETAARAAMTAELGVQMPLTTLLAHASGVRLSLLLPPSRQTEPPILRLSGS